MSRTLFASDLDRTLIYSADARSLGADASPCVCVELYNDEPASFVTSAAAALLVELYRAGEFVPVTTRTPEQYRRVRLPGPEPRYAVAANGGVLLAEGVPDPAWTRRVGARLAEAAPLSEVFDYIGRLCRPEFTVNLRVAADLFCYAVVRPAELPAGFVADVTGWAAERGWRTSLQGRKLYWVPAGLTKSAAVAEVAERTGCGRVLAAGDSLLDIDLLLAADAGIRPRHGELFEQSWTAPHVVTTAAGGITAGEQIVAWFLTSGRQSTRATSVCAKSSPL